MLIEKINKIDADAVQGVAEDVFDLEKFNLISYIPEK